MLLELAITDFAIIPSSRITFGPGMHVLTGETGAGKSILLDALGLVLGDRASTDMVRTGCRRARVEALFALEGERGGRVRMALTDQGIEHDDTTIVLTREVNETGRSTARINGQIVTVGQLDAIGDLLVDIHGQSDHFAIRRKEEQRRILDRYAGLETQAGEVATLVVRVTDLRRRLSTLASGERERAQRRDLLAFQVDEIDGLGLQPDEDAALGQEQRVLGNADLLREVSLRAVAILSGDETGTDDVVSALRLAEQGTARGASVDSALAALSERLAEVAILAEEVAHDLRAYLDTVEVNDQRLAEIEERLEAIRTAKRKYGASIEDVLAYRDTAETELQSLTGDEFDTEALSAQLDTAERKLGSAVVDLSLARQVAAARLSGEIEASIASLRMGAGVVEIAVTRHDDPDGIAVEIDGETRTLRFDRTGIDDVEILVAPNRGESPKPLGRIASGGETARVMLAFKSVLSEHDATPTLVFDEIDVGVGGRTGQVVGERLRDLAGRHQVIVITHLPQIAALADRHAKISKFEVDSRVVSRVSDLDGAEVEQEIAAMLDGEPPTAASIKAAREMLSRSRHYRERVG